MPEETQKDSGEEETPQARAIRLEAHRLDIQSRVESIRTGIEEVRLEIAENMQMAEHCVTAFDQTLRQIGDQLIASIPTDFSHPLPLTEVLSYLLDDIKELAESREIQIETFLTDQKVVFESWALIWIVEYVITNALAHAPAGSTIQVILLGDPVRLTINDQGPGVATEALETIFVQPSDSEKTESLFQVRRLMELQGGRAYAKNREGVGLSMTLEFKR